MVANKQQLSGTMQISPGLLSKVVSPGWEGSRPGLSCEKKSAKGPVSRILSCAVIPLGAALPRTLISDLPGGFAIAWSGR